MTIKQCYEIFKRHLGRGNSANINQDEKELEDRFRWFLNPAISFICSILKPVKSFKAYKKKNEPIIVPDDFFKLKKLIIQGNVVRDYQVISNAVFAPEYEGEAEVIYYYIAMTDSSLIDNTPLDLPAVYENIVPVYIAAQAIKNEDESLYKILYDEFENQINILKSEKISQTSASHVDRLYTI